MKKSLNLQFCFCLKAFLTGFAAILFCFVFPCFGDVLFIHDYKIKEYLIGEKEAELAVNYTEQGMFADKKTRYTGSWMKRLFGKVEEKRETVNFLLNKNEIWEIDWYRGKIIVFPFEKMKDTKWMTQQAEKQKAMEEFLKERYRVSTPELSIKSFPEKKKINGYVCRYVEAKLRLETADVKKKAASITLIDQKLWVSEEVPGFGEYQAFHKKLGEKLGLDAARLGNMNFLLRYWKGSLDSIRESLDAVRGYPVKKIVTVDGEYVKGVDTDSPQIHSFQIKTEQTTLREVLSGKVDMKRFQPPENFGKIKSEPKSR